MFVLRFETDNAAFANDVGRWKLTAGPWIAENMSAGGHPHNWYVRDASGSQIGNFSQWGFAEANAKLIAQAPAMAHVLQSFLAVQAAYGNGIMAKQFREAREVLEAAGL